MNHRHIFVSALIAAAATASFAQPNRISSRIDKSRTHTLSGHVHPFAVAANDRGEVDSGFALPRMTMMLHPSAAQQTDLQQLLRDQQNPMSSSYHQWLTPEQYADRFGVSASDAAQIVSWLEGQGFTVDPVSRSRTFITFGGTAGLVQSAFDTAIHRYRVNGTTHFANASDPDVPAALSSVVSNIRGLHNFYPTAKLAKAQPRDTLGPGNHELVPDDFATIYDVTPMYSAGINGTGQKIAVVGQSALYKSGADITSFWSKFGITSAKLVPTLVPRTFTPGVVPGDVDESSLDIEWAGAVARNATIVFVYADVSYGGVWTAAQYAVDNALAPVLSMSYGLCEMEDLADLPSLHQTVQQANAEGITWLAASGDAGAADCDAAAGVAEAEGGLTVDEPGSMPEVTSMGGTAVSNSGAYWNTNNSATFASAKGYIPESAWNDTALSVPAGDGLSATGGGASAYFAQPAWQTSAGVPSDGWRHVPDISFNSSTVVAYDVLVNGSEVGYGGTSAATPTMAGVVAMLNQYLKTNGLGNINPTLYSLSQAAPNAFHNIAAGNNIVPCAYASPGCINGQEGYSAVPGYNSATGLGSVDVTKLIQQWSTAAATGPTIVASLDQNPVYQGNAESCGNSNSWNFQITLAEEAGFAASVTGMSINGVDYSAQIGSIFGTSSIGARQTISGCLSLSSVNAPANEAFKFSGSPNNWSTTLNMSFQGPQTQTAVSAVTNAASYAQTYAPGMLLAVFGAGMGSLGQLASTIPFPEYMAGVTAVICPSSCNSGVLYPVPLYYVGPNQLNIQIPYEVSGSVDLNVATPYNPGGVDYFFTVSAIAPGIFTMPDGSNDLNPSRTASAGQTTFLFITGEGRVTPSLQDGNTPPAGTPLANLPRPRQAVTVSVGGMPAPTTFVGIPSGLVGVTQVNFTIPSNVPSGRQPVIVTVGTTSSPPAYITIQ